MAKKRRKDDKADESASKGSKSKLFAAGGLLVIGLAAYQFVLKPAPAETAATETTQPAEGAIYQFDEMVLNLDDPNVDYIRIGLAIVLTDTEDPALFAADEAIAKDVAVDYLGSLSAADFKAGPARQKTKQTLSDKMIEAYGPDRVVRVLFTGLVMQ